MISVRAPRSSVFTEEVKSGKVIALKRREKEGYQMSKEINIPLDIPNIRVLSTKTNEKGDYVITVESTLGHAHCGRCGQKIDPYHRHDRLIQ